MNTPIKEIENPILVCVEKPTIEGAPTGRSIVTLPWTSLTDVLAENTKQAGSSDPLIGNAKRLADNLWLFDEKDSVLHLQNFVRACRGWGLTCKAYKVHGTLENLDGL